MTVSPHLLIVDDDREICVLLSKFFAGHGYRVSSAADGAAMIKLLEAGRIDLIVLDLMLPGEDGLSLCRRVRASSSVPIIMLTAIGEETDRIIGLEMGADDYLAKPFNPRELLARIKAVLRRAGTARLAMLPKERVFSFEGWQLETARRQLCRSGGALVPLRAAEYELLLAFIEHPQRVLSRDQLLDLARGRSSSPFDRSVDVLVSRLRRKIETDPEAPRLIQTVRGGGYIFSAVVDSDEAALCA